MSTRGTPVSARTLPCRPETFLRLPGPLCVDYAPPPMSNQAMLVYMGSEATTSALVFCQCISSIDELPPERSKSCQKFMILSKSSFKNTHRTQTANEFHHNLHHVAEWYLFLWECLSTLYCNAQFRLRSIGFTTTWAVSPPAAKIFLRCIL